MVNYPSSACQASDQSGSNPATVEIPYKTAPGSVLVSLRRWQFVQKVDELSAQGFLVDIDKIHRDGYNSAEDLPVIHQQPRTIPEDRHPPDQQSKKTP